MWRRLSYLVIPKGDIGLSFQLSLDRQNGRDCRLMGEVPNKWF